MSTLDELKAKNAEEEANAAKVTATEAEEVETEAVEDADIDAEEPAEADSGDGGESDPEAWMQSDDQTSEGSGGVVPLKALVKTRERLKGRISEKDSEIEQLKAKIAALEQGTPRPQVQQQLRPMPTLAECGYDEAKHAQAIAEWVDERTDAKLKAQTFASTQKEQGAALERQISQRVEDHYQRAADLVAKQGITAEVYQAADTRFRAAIEAVRPGQGDKIADFLISKLGEGSEKVGFYVGRNGEALNTVQTLLQADPSGIEAAMYLGSLKAKVTMPVQRKSNAPKPPVQIGGSGDASASTLARQLKDKYRRAVKEDNAQARLDIRREARKAGLNPDDF